MDDGLNFCEFPFCPVKSNCRNVKKSRMNPFIPHFYEYNEEYYDVLQSIDMIFRKTKEDGIGQIILLHRVDTPNMQLKACIAVISQNIFRFKNYIKRLLTSFVRFSV